MQVDRDLNKRNQVGIFNPGVTYEVSVRFSNASPRANNDDNQSDSRGIGIKVHHNSGAPHVISADSNDSELKGSQGFTMNSTDSFFADTAETYRQFMQRALLESEENFGKSIAKWLAFDVDPRLAFRVVRSLLKIRSSKASNPLGLQYFSITPFQHGTGSEAPIVKYSVVPCGGAWQENFDSTDKNFLRTNLKKHITSKPACFRFLVQHRTSDTLNIEDPTQPWSAKVAPFEEIATITLPAQAPAEEKSCEKIVINPWNTRPEHKPVGGINRLRLSNYLMSIERRQKTAVSESQDSAR